MIINELGDEPDRIVCVEEPDGPRAENKNNPSAHCLGNASLSVDCMSLSNSILSKQSRTKLDCIGLARKAKFILASSKLMNLMTQSQLDHLKVQTNQLQIKCRMLKQPTIKAYLLETLRPFKFLLNNKNLSLKIDDRTHENINNLSSQNKINAFICTDFKIYEEILFHLMANACKFSPESSRIEIEVRLNYENEVKSVKSENEDSQYGVG